MTVQLDCLQIAKAAGLGQGKTSGKEILFHCSRHPDKHPSLSIHPEKNKWFCGPCGKGGGAWLLAAFLSGHNPFEKRRISAWLHEHGVLDGEGENKRPRKCIAPGIETAVYSYEDENGSELFQVVRYEPKTFRQRRPDGKGGYTWKLDGVRRVLYRLPELISELKEKIATLWLDLGLRPAEICRLRPEDLDWDNLRLLVQHGNSKAAKRVLPMVDAVYTRLRAWYEQLGRPEDGWLFPAPKDPTRHVNKKGVHEFHKATLEAAGLPTDKANPEYFVPYAMRHTCFTEMANEGCPSRTSPRRPGTVRS